jgi:hypothetical protein
LVAGYEAPPSSFKPQIQRLGADGTADPNYLYFTEPNNQGLHPVPAAFLPDGGAVVVRNPTAGDRRVSFFYLTPTGKLAGSVDLPNAVNDRGVVGVGTLTTRAFAMQPDGKLLFAQAFVDGAQNVFGLFRLPPPPAPAPPVITLHPLSKSIGAGEGLFLTVTATSGSPLSYQWQHAGTNLPTQTTQSLNLATNSRERDGDFLVVVSNAFGAVTSQVARITVRPPAPMVMTQQPIGGTVKLSQNFNLSAQCSTEVPTGHQWYQNGSPYPGGAGQGFGNAALTLFANDASRTGDYFVVFTNDFAGSVTSGIAHLDLVLPGPPQLTRQPADQALYSAQPVQLTVTAVADGTLTYQWQHAGTNLKSSPAAPNVTSATLVVSAAEANRFGEYRLIASVNPGGSTTSRVATITALPPGPPVLLSEPVAFAVPFGQGTNLSVGFNGEAPLTLYWFHAGTNVLFLRGLPGLSLPNLDAPTSIAYNFPGLPDFAGGYLAIVSNRFGTVTSRLATVTVQPPAAATVLAEPTNRVVGIGEFNFVGLRQGLVVTNSNGVETTHVLAMHVESGLPPFRGSGLWHLALGTSNRFYIGENSGGAAATGTWGYVSGASPFFALTNYPRLGDLSRLEAYEDGRYSLILGGNTVVVQGGSYRVLGARRPATITGWRRWACRRSSRRSSRRNESATGFASA